MRSKTWAGGFYLRAVCLLFFISTVAAIIMMCWTPPVSRDALTHHLLVPNLYVQNGGIVELPHIKYSYYPQLLDLIYTIPLIFGNDILPKYIHFSFALLTAIILYLYIQKRLNGFFALFGVSLFLSLPVIVKLSITVYVDLGLIFFSTASFFSLFKWRETHKFRWLAIAAVCCGLALSTKYNGLITLFILTCFVPLMFLEGKKKNIGLQIKSMGFGFLFFLISIGVFSPWMIKNYIWTQNPVYPLYDGFFNRPDMLDKERGGNEKQKSPFFIRKYVYKEPFWYTAMIPARIFFEGKDDNPAYFDGKLNPLLFVLPCCFFGSMIWRKKTAEDTDLFEKKMMFLYSIFYILAVFFQTDMRIRWIGPAIPALIILSVWGAKAVFSQFIPYLTYQFSKYWVEKWLKVICVSIIVCMLGLNVKYMVNLFQAVNPVPYITKQVNRSEYIEKFRPEFLAFDFANKNLSRETVILGLFIGNRGYYSNHKIVFDLTGFQNAVVLSLTSADLLEQLQSAGYRNILINFEKFERWALANCSPVKINMLKDFFVIHARPLFHQGGYGLFQLN